MSNSIWKKPEEEPKDFCDVVLANSRTGSCCVFFTPFHNVSFDYDKWCYLTDLIAQADKAERLQKALDVAVDAIKNATEYLGNQEPLVDVMAMNLYTDLSKTLDKITAPEQKGNQ